jgi:predicted small lipoprotein YifL
MNTMRTRLTVFMIAAILVAVFTLSGCGDNSSGPSEAQLDAAKAEGERAAHEKDRIDNLQKQVRSLKHRSGHAATAAPSEEQAAGSVSSEPSEAGASSVLRSFHAPSGNVSCEILSDGALCSVDSIALTFTFSDGQPARIESGAALPRGAGEPAAYGTTVSAGSITCTIPRSDDPHGITCVDAASGHGFEASRVSSRQHTY